MEFEFENSEADERLITEDEARELGKIALDE